MKRLLLFICTLLCANVLMAQTMFWIGDIEYQVTSTNPAEVEVYWCPINPTTVNIPETVSYEGTTYSVTAIDDSAFYECSNLTSITIPNSVTSIGSRAFHECISLTSVTIPNSVTSIGEGVFYNCSSLTSVTLSNNITSLSPFSDSYGDYGFFEGCSSLTSITIPNSVTSIGNDAFKNCSSLTSVTIGNSVTSIGDWAFFDCSSLTSVTIPNSVTTIGNSAFYNCSSLTSVTIPNSVTYIGNYTFYGCSSLTSIDIPNGVTSIGNSAFYNCSSLTSVITIPNSVTSIGEFAFYNCSSLTSVTIPNSVTSIGNNAFAGCGSLTSIDIPNSVTSIEYGAFSSCTALQNLTLGENVASIGSGAFRSSSFLQNVTCLATIPPTLADNTVFPYPNIATLTIPCGTLEAYSSPTSFWNMFFMGRISEDGYEVVANVNNDAFGSVAIENNCSTATLTANANACYQFVGWNDGNTENPRIVTLSSDTTLTANFEVMVVNNDITATICEGQVYNENGFNVSEAGVYTQSLQTINGCDSVVTLTLNVTPSYNTNLTATICEGSELSISGFNVSEAGVYTQTHTAVNGCDSVVTLTVTELPIIHTDLTLSICEGTSINFSGFNVNEGGVYTQSYTAVNGCDSIVTLTVTELPIVHTNLTLEICEGTSLNFSGFNVTEAGTYTQTHTAANGCDSIVTLVVTTYPTFDTTINATINPGETYAEFGFNESEAGTYVQNLQTVNGCDSTITLILDVNSSLLDVEDTELSFYPNPTDSKITFSSTIERIEVIDLTGRCVLTFSNAREINIESLPSGAYYLRLTNNDKAIMRKVIKE
ncbi:MAG: leucine-rich repeat domain-containing protein [Bacteroidales bacterium]|nr:leucine-rich repeat domain-containing protein [Bacteroidales bacterium]